MAPIERTPEFESALRDLYKHYAKMKRRGPPDRLFKATTDFLAYQQTIGDLLQAIGEQND